MLDLEDAVPPHAQGRRAPDGRRRAGRPTTRARGCGSTPPAPSVRGRPRRGRRARLRHPHPQDRVARRRRVGGGPSAGHADHLRDRERARACWPRRRSPRRPASGTWPWAGSTCSATSTPTAATCRRPTSARHLVVSSRAAGIEPPIDSVYPAAGRRSRAAFAGASSRGRWASSASPRSTRGSCRSCTRCSRPSEREMAWAREVLAAFDAAGGDALRLPDGEFVDLPVAQRARRMLQLADAVPRALAGAVSERSERTSVTAPREACDRAQRGSAKSAGAAHLVWPAHPPQRLRRSDHAVTCGNRLGSRPSRSSVRRHGRIRGTGRGAAGRGPAGAEVVDGLAVLPLADVVREAVGTGAARRGRRCRCRALAVAWRTRLAATAAAVAQQAGALRVAVDGYDRAERGAVAALVGEP